MKKRSIHAAIKNLDGLGDVRKHVKKHALLVLLVGAMVAGMVVGAVTARQADDNLLRTLDFLFNGNYQARAEQTMASTFAASLASSFVFVLLCALMGLSLWGAFLVPAVPFFRGFGFGLTAGYLCASFSWKGLAFYACVMLPGMFLSAIATVLAAREASRFSSALIARGFPGSDSNYSVKGMQLFFIRNGFVLILSAFAAVLDMALAAFFAGLFVF